MTDLFDAASTTIEEVVPTIVARHREAGILTWKLMHQIESEIFAEVSATGRLDPQILNMLRSSPAFGYKKDDSPVSLAGHSIVPIAFSAIDAAWQRVN